ncbi:collagen-binding domain-containing protein [Alteromonas gracilis]|uniref:collagen-binding domain-containing protein n=1 Tax=Alteromonas gracilis TaxID=1479524 RepID=UPI003735B57B
MKKKILYTAVLAAVMSAPYVSAAKIELSEAFEYNAFIFDSYTGQSSDVEGRMAVGGEMRVTDFNVGLLLPPNMAESALAVGGNLHFNRGDVHGGTTTVSGMVFGSELTFDKALNAQQTVNLINSTVESGGISSQGDVKLGNSKVISGDIHANTVKLGGPNSVYSSVSNTGEYGSQVEDGNVYAESGVELDSSEVNGAVTLNDANNYSAINGSKSAAINQGSVKKAVVDNIDFDAIATEVTAQSQEFASMAANGVTTLSCTDASDPNKAVACTDPNDTTLHTITFSGSDDINVYNIDSGWFSAADKGIVYDFSTTSYNIINVYGESVELFNTGFFNTAFTQENKYFRENGQYKDNDNNVNRRHDGRFTNNILFNFVDADFLTLHSVGVKGSVLAPYAELSFYNGHVDGNVIANRLVTPLVELVNDKGETYNAPTGQINNYQFGAIDVSEPASLAILFGAGCLMLARRSKSS